MKGFLHPWSRLWPALLFAVALPVSGQQSGGAGSIFGLVTESDSGNAITNVAVNIVGNPQRGVSGSDGRYSILLVPAGVYEVSFSQPDYERQIVREVKVVAGEATELNVNLRLPMFELELMEVMADPLAGLDAGLLIERQQSAVSFDAVGSEFIGRVGASDAADIVGKVTGVTVSDGKNPVVRGLNERYVGVTLNGAEVPSADPYRKSAQLDLFPSSLIESIVVTKTFTPDLPGNFTGGGVNIITKSFPEKFFFNASIGGKYNTKSSFNPNFLSYSGGSFDWAGVDDGTRALNPPLDDPNLTLPATPPFSSGAPGSATYQQRTADAAKLDSLTRDLGLTEFAGTKETSLFDYNFASSIGDTIQLGGRPFGYFAGVSYNREFDFYDDGISRRYAPGASPGTFDVRKDFHDEKSTAIGSWATVANLAYKPADNHEFAFNFLNNQVGEDEVRYQEGTTTDDPGLDFFVNRIHFTERNLRTFQLRGQHEFPDAWGLKANWLAAVSSTTQDEPDGRFFNFLRSSGTFSVDSNALPDPKNPTRFWRELEESNRNFKLDFSLPVPRSADLDGELKTGFFSSQADRTFKEREFYYQGNSSTTSQYPFTGDPNTFLTPDNLGYTAVTNPTTGRITYTWNRYIQQRNSSYDGDYTILAGYAMLDYPIIEKLRLVGGARYETTDISVDSRSYLPNSITGSAINSSQLKQTDLLPAAGLIWSLRTNMNVRLNYGETLARPTFRELAGYRSYDPFLDELLDGNPRLKMSSIKNYDLRWEWFPRAGEVLSAGFFYKDLKNAIERKFVTNDGEIISYDNRETGNVLGIELEARKNLDFMSDLLKEFSFGINLALIESEVPLTQAELVAKRAVLPDTSDKRLLYDQSPYVLNTDLTFDHPETGTTATVVFNIFGPRIVIASLNSPDVYEQPAPTLDFLVSQRLGKGWKVKLSAKNLLDPAIERTYGKDGSDTLFSSYHKGRSFGLSLSYDF
ncbi:TonB-dependent receptor plug domain-containing protein [bacterium]|nr:TonB-dependent receptor plug domain-containing protein [bacterium]